MHRQLPCTQARRLSLDESLRATEGGSEKTGETSSHSPLLFVKNEAPEEEAAQVDTAQRLAPKQQQQQQKTKQNKTKPSVKFECY